MDYRKELSIRIFINPDYWDSINQMVKPSDESEYINN